MFLGGAGNANVETSSSGVRLRVVKPPSVHLFFLGHEVKPVNLLYISISVSGGKETQQYSLRKGG